MTSYKNSIRKIKISKHDILGYASLHPDDNGWNHWDSIPDYVYDYIKCLESEIASLKSREKDAARKGIKDAIKVYHMQSISPLVSFHTAPSVVAYFNEYADTVLGDDK